MIYKQFVKETPPPREFSVRWLYTKSYFLKVKFLRGQFLTKGLVYQEGISRIIL